MEETLQCLDYDQLIKLIYNQAKMRKANKFQ